MGLVIRVVLELWQAAQKGKVFKKVSRSGAIKTPISLKSAEAYISIRST